MNMIHQDHWGAAHGCHSDTPVNLRKLDTCTLNNEFIDVVYLIGDSNADQFSEAVIAFAKAKSKKLIIFTISGCPFLPGYVMAPNNRWTRDKPIACQNYYQSTLKYLQTHQKGTVFLAFSDQYFRETGWTLGKTATVGSTLISDRQDFLRLQFLAAITDLKSTGNKLIFIDTIPQLNYQFNNRTILSSDYSPTNCSLIAIFQRRCDRKLSLVNYNLVQKPLKNIENSILRTLGVPHYDFTSIFFIRGVASNRISSNWIYKDGAHISTSESHKFGQILQTEEPEL